MTSSSAVTGITQLHFDKGPQGQTVVANTPYPEGTAGMDMIIGSANMGTLFDGGILTLNALSDAISIV